MVTESRPRSRRSILTGALGAAGGAVALWLGRPQAADATVAAMETGADNPADAPTRLSSTAPTLVLGVATATMPAYEIGEEVVAIGSDQFAFPALNVVSANVDDALALQVAAPGGIDGISTGIKVAAGGTGIRAEQQDEFGAGVLGIANGSEAAGVEGGGRGGSSVGVSGWSQGSTGIGVNGTAVGNGTGGRFASETGTALKVSGRASFSRSGRALVPRGHSYVDVTVRGGLSTSTSVVLATIQTYRPGVAVAGVRLNYPATGKARVYLTRIASTTETTPIGWFVLG